MVSTSASAGTAWAVAPLPGGSWVIAIDSLTMQGNEQTTGCKLYQFGDALFANYGVVSLDTIDGSPYGAHHLMQSALAETGSLDEALLVFEPRAKSLLERLFQEVSEDSRQEQIAANLMTGVIIAAVEDGAPRLRHRMLTISESRQMRWEDGRMPSFPDELVWAAGVSETPARAAIRRRVQARSHANTISTAIDIVTTAADLVQSVGLPVSAAVVDASGPHWLRGYDQCSNAQP